MKVIISSPAHWVNIYELIQRSVRDNVVNVTFEPVKRHKTKKQLGFIFGAIISNLQVYYFDCTGEKFTPDDLKEMIYQEIGVFEEKQYPNGKTYKSCITLSKMDVEQASQFINDLLNWIDNKTELILTPDVRYCWTHSVNDDDLREARKELPEKINLYLVHLRKLHCLHCGVIAGQAHHMRSGQYSGIAKKSPDWFTIPVCPNCHEFIHVNESGFLRNIRNVLYGLSIEDFCRLNFIRWQKKES